MLFRSYFKDPLFFGESRIVSIVGQNRYSDTVSNWHKIGNMEVREVEADEMNIDVSITAVSAADAFMARTMRTAAVKEFLGAVGQVPGIWEDIRDEYKWSELFGEMFNQGGFDTDRLKRTDEEKQKLQQGRQQAQQQAQQQAMQQQLQLMASQEQAKGKREVTVAQTKAQGDIQRDQGRISAEHQSTMREVTAKVGEQLSADLRKITTELSIQHMNTIAEMREEFRLEMAAIRTGDRISIGKGGDTINQSGTS